MPVRFILFILFASLVSLGCSGDSGTTEAASEASATTTTGMTTSAGTTSAGTSTSDTGFGTTFDPKPAKCPQTQSNCTPPDMDTGTDTGDLCEPYYVELEAIVKDSCLGVLEVVGRRVDEQGSCCVDSVCHLPRPEAKACIPLSAAGECMDYISGIPWSEICGILGSHGEPFVDGDLCCMFFDCYCGDTG